MSGAGVPLALDGVITADQARQTARAIAAAQEPDGAIPWFAGEHLDPWDHTEAAMALDAAGLHEDAERAYRWLARRQNRDGSWYASYTAGAVSDDNRETNFTSYIAVGAWHHYLATGDDAFLAELWPTLDAAIEWVIALQAPGGQIRWACDAAGTARDEALLTGSSSVYHALRCALAVAERLGEPRPDWEVAAGRLAHAVTDHPERFAPKARYSMDWYYPILGTALRGPRAGWRLAVGWHRFVVPGFGVRCVDDRPWVTGAETAELTLALWALGEERRARDILGSMQHLRCEDGTYWTGYVFADDAIWPEERTTWTAAAVLLATAALTGHPATTAVFGGAALPVGLAPDEVECAAARCAGPDGDAA